MIASLGFLTLILVAITVDPMRLPPFVWLIICLVAAMWWVCFSPSRKDF